MQSFNQQANAFLFSSNEVRTATDDRGDVWFCAKDVAACLDIYWSSKTLRTMPEEWTSRVRSTTEHGERDMVYLSEPGLYRLIFRSNKPVAIEFTNWVCCEVLPALRKQGFFGLISPSEQIKCTNQLIQLTEKLRATKDAFVFQILERRLRNLCNLLGEPMPSMDLLGKDREQLSLPV